LQQVVEIASSHLAGLKAATDSGLD